MFSFLQISTNSVRLFYSHNIYAMPSKRQICSKCQNAMLGCVYTQIMRTFIGCTRNEHRPDLSDFFFDLNAKFIPKLFRNYRNQFVDNLFEKKNHLSACNRNCSKFVSMNSNFRLEINRMYLCSFSLRAFDNTQAERKSEKSTNTRRPK